MCPAPNERAPEGDCCVVWMVLVAAVQAGIIGVGIWALLGLKRQELGSERSGAAPSSPER